MKRIWIGAVLLGTAGGAQAADLPARVGYTKAPVAMVYDWTGFYFGVNAGVGAGRNRETLSYPAAGSLNTIYVQPQGGFGGGQAGYNWQTNSFLGPLVIGVEADIQGGGLNDGSNSLLGVGASNVTINQKLDWFATARGRIGLSRGPALGYVTGGYAYGNVKTSVSESGIGTFSSDRGRSGWVVGSGIEAALGGNWTGKIEYLHLNLGNRTDDFVLGTPQSLRSELHENIFRLGLNYRIGGVGYVAAPPANWAGLYLGGNFGSGYARNRSSLTIVGTPISEQFSLAPDGLIGGGQIGYNWQAANWVYGVEADFQGSTQKDNSTQVLLSTVAYNAKLPWFGTARGRIGYSVGSTLFYATGGYAYGNIKTEINSTFGGANLASLKTSKGGWTAGAGIETPFKLFGLLGPNWTSKNEYLYVDLGSVSNAIGGGVLVNTTKVQEHIFRTGINYHFNSPVIAKY
jgi:outer membrane immunogenic protein